MNTLYRTVGLGVLVMMMAVAVHADSTGPDPIEKTMDGRRTMIRTADFVVIHGRLLESNLDTPIERLALFAAVDGRLSPIPFQIDELDANGDWVLTQTPPTAGGKGIPIDRDEDNGRLDANDELVFMIRDAGERFTDGAFPEGMADIGEIMLDDPVDGGKAWVYIGEFASDPPRSPVHYIEYRMPEGRIVSRDYELGFSETVPISWDHARLRGGPNIVDRLKIRARVRAFGMQVDKNEEDFLSEASLFREGPIRVIRRSRNSIRITKRIHTPRADFESIYYDNAVIIPFRISVPYFPGLLKKIAGLKSQVRGGCDMRNMHGWKMKPDVDPRWLTIDGRMDDLERTFNREDSTSLVLADPPGAVFLRMILDRKWDGTPQSLPVKTTLFYMDDDTLDDPPEFAPGQSPNVGFWMSRLENISHGVFYFFMVCHMIADYEDGQESEWMKIMDAPVRVTVQPVHAP